METVSTNEYNANSVPDSGSRKPAFSAACTVNYVILTRRGRQNGRGVRERQARTPRHRMGPGK